MIYRSTYPPYHVPTDVSIPQFLQRYNPDDAPADKIILEDDWTGEKLSYGDFRGPLVAKRAWALRHDFGINEQDVVCISGWNSVQHALLIHAVLWAGGIAALVNPLSTSDELAHCMSICRPKLLAINPELVSTARKAFEQPAFTAVPTPNLLLFNEKAPCTSSIRTLSDLGRTGEQLPVLDLSGRDSREYTACVCYSSGTSGKPKGVELTHHNLLSSIASMRAGDPTFYYADSRSVFFAPLCHIYGLVSIVLSGTYLGHYTLLMKKYTLNDLVELSSRIKATCLRILPSVATAMAKDPDLDLSKLQDIKHILCSGAVLPTSTISFLHSKFNSAPIFQGYGMTETNIATLRPHLASNVGSVGKLFPLVEARVVDDDLNDVKPGMTGEMLVRGPTVFRRYMNNPEATNETIISGGWMRTGDILRVDEEGYLYLTDRKKELIKYKGYQVPPGELEGYVSSHPYINEVAVCATWDSNQETEIPIAYVTLTKEGKAAHGGDTAKSLEQVRQSVDERVSPYKRLRGGIVEIDEIPKTGTGKILRRELPARKARDRAAKL